MITELKPHNYRAWQRVTEALGRERMACVVHPTGTGKSYIVASVAEGYKRVLILAPNRFVLRQQRNVLHWHKGVDYATYQWLAYQDEDVRKRYDLIVLDEFHRAGAPEWQQCVIRLLEQQAQAKVLGTSATPVRYLDGARNMADELFEGRVASEMSIAEAWHLNILPVPHYVTAFFNFEHITREAEQRIRDNKRIPDREKRGRIHRLSNARLDWQRSMGVPAILQRHLPKDTRRVIVFCAHIDTARRMSVEVSRWFAEAGFSVVSSGILHSDMSEQAQSRAMHVFERNTEGGGVRLLFSINMLNEGVHIPQVSAVLMLRTTSSHIIYMQQMGRALTAAFIDRPVVLDMVDNITTSTFVSTIGAEFEQLEREAAGNGPLPPRRFEVTDYTLSVRQMIERLTGFASSYTESITMLQKWFNANHRAPSKRSDDEYEAFLGKRWLYIKKMYPKHDAVVTMMKMEDGARVKAHKKDIDDIKNFCLLNNRLPMLHSDALNAAVQRVKLAEPGVYAELLNQYGKVGKMKREVLTLVRAYIEEHGYQPRQVHDKSLAVRWSCLKRKQPNDPEVRELSRYPKMYRNNKSKEERLIYPNPEQQDL